MAAVFPHDTYVTIDFMVSLMRSRTDASRPLETLADLESLLQPFSITGFRTRDEAELHAIIALRDEVEQLWDAPRDDAAVTVNRILTGAGAVPQLVRHDQYDWHVHAVSDAAPLAARFAAECAMAFVDLVRIDETERCKRCTDAQCTNAFFDQSRNRSRRFCSTTCQSRTNVAAFRARRAAESAA